jgi:hypothetical protein
MSLAAYEVLLNKKNWRANDAARRDAWTPTFGLLDERTSFALPGEKMTEAAQFYDAYGAFPMRPTAHPHFALGRDYWPRRPSQMQWAGRLEVLPRGSLLARV